MLHVTQNFTLIQTFASNILKHIGKILVLVQYWYNIGTIGTILVKILVNIGIIGTIAKKYWYKIKYWYKYKKILVQYFILVQLQMNKTRKLVQGNFLDRSTVGLKKCELKF